MDNLAFLIHCIVHSFESYQNIIRNMMISLTMNLLIVRVLIYILQLICMYILSILQLLIELKLYNNTNYIFSFNFL